MENRIFVGKREDSINFFRDVKKYANFSSYKQLYPLLKINHGEFWFLQTGKRSLTQSRFDLLNDYLPKEIREKYQPLLDIRPENWGEKIGGKTTATRYPNHIVKARTVANTKAKEKADTRFDIRQPITADIAEFLGAFAGDGFTNKYGRHYFTGFAGDRRYDWDYYQTKIIPIVKKYFNIHHQTIREKDNSMWVTFHCKLLHEMLIQRFGMPAGVKFDKVRIPLEILNGKPEHKIAFIRGVLDTDGCVFFDKRKTYKTPYFRIDICMYNIPILDEIAQLLNDLGIYAKRLSNGKHVHITSKKDVEKFLQTIGSSNQRHIAKIKRKYADFEEWNPSNLQGACRISVKLR